MAQFNQEAKGRRTRSAGFVRKALAAALFLGTFAVTEPLEAAENQLDTVYHVYIENKYIGTVSDEKIVKEAVDERIGKLRETYKEFELEAGSSIAVIAEQVFRSRTNTNNEEVRSVMEESAPVEVAAKAIVIEGKPAVYVKSQEDAMEVMKQLKLAYLSEDELKNAEARMASEETLKPIEGKGSRIVEVRLEEDLKLEDETVTPNQVLSPKDAAAFLRKGTLEEKQYAIQKGDVFGRIASNHNMTMEQLKQLNPGVTEDSLLHIGQKLNVTAPKPLAHVVVNREVKLIEPVDFEKEVIEDPNLPKGETKVKQKGKTGKSTLTYMISETNGMRTGKALLEEEVLEKPEKRIVIKGTKVIPSRGTGSLVWPVNGGYVSSEMGHRWGRTHKGIDIARPSNLNIKAADNGVVVSAGWDSGGYGNKIVIDHQNGYRTIYAHLNSIDVSAGQIVGQGQTIGIMGSTGDSTGTHLHFEVYKNGSLQNPLKFF